MIEWPSVPVDLWIWADGVIHESEVADQVAELLDGISLDREVEWVRYAKGVLRHLDVDEALQAADELRSAGLYAVIDAEAYHDEEVQS
jgi:hypothetical protein